jgi:hypothetical protein
MTSSYDGYDWTKWRYTGLSVWAQNVRVYQNQLVMVWSSLHDSNIWYVTSTDGLKWKIVGKTGANTTTTPSVTTINVQGNKRMISVFTDNGGNGDVWSSYYPGGNGGWNSVQKIAGLNSDFPIVSSIPATMPTGSDILFMAYNSAQGSPSQLSAARSTDLTGVVWSAPFQLAEQQRGVPTTMTLFNNSMHIIYQNNRNMFVASALSGDLATKNDSTNPTQQDLANNTESQWYVQINQSQNNGQPVGQAPMYYAV